MEALRWLVVGTVLVVGCGDDSGGNADAGADSGADAGADSGADAGTDGGEPTLPVTAVELVSEGFMSAEGIAFNGEGRLFVTASLDNGGRDLYEVQTDGGTALIADLQDGIGLASRGASDILVADFGPTSFTNDGANSDGLVLSVTPAGAMTTLATGIGDPNFIHVRPDGTLLVSDDFTDIIYESDGAGGDATVFLQGIQSPNGVVEAFDGSELYVAQTFTTLMPLSFDGRVWRVPLDGSGDPGTPVELTTLEGPGANDGVTIDAKGRVYVAENLAGQVWRIDPATDQVELVAEGVSTVASLAFGEGAFNATSIYATQLFGGKVWEIPVGVAGAVPNR